jgi:hypothetical protein
MPWLHKKNLKVTPEPTLPEPTRNALKLRVWHAMHRAYVVDLETRVSRSTVNLDSNEKKMQSMQRDYERQLAEMERAKAQV